MCSDSFVMHCVLQRDHYINNHLCTYHAWMSTQYICNAGIHVPWSCINKPSPENWFVPTSGGCSPRIRDNICVVSLGRFVFPKLSLISEWLIIFKWSGCFTDLLVVKVNIFWGKSIVSCTIEEVWSQKLLLPEFCYSCSYWAERRKCIKVQFWPWYTKWINSCCISVEALLANSIAYAYCKEINLRFTEKNFKTPLKNSCC